MKTNLQISQSADIRAQAELLCNDANAFFHYSHNEMQTISRESLEVLQLAGLQYRFESLRDHIPMLKKLADKQAIDNLETIDAAVPLLFEHTMYKSYPPSLLERGRFADIVRWIAKLVAMDLSDIDVSGCASIDEWVELLDRESPLSIIHSSGTSGSMSFLPCSKREWEKFGLGQKIQLTQPFGAPPAEEEDLYAIYPYFRSGAAAHLRNNDNTVQFFVGSEDRLLCAYPTRMSSDVLYLAAKIRAAQVNGELDRLQISPTLLARKTEYEAMQADMPEHLAHFFDEAIAKFAGKRVYVCGTWNILHGMATAALAKGLENIFSPDSVVVTGGGAKGMEPPANWQQDVQRFIGANSIQSFYAMSEIQGGHMMCSHGHYHFVPWVIPYLLDPETSKVLPRRGVVTGRASFYDLSAETRWGGFITGDEITINWDEPCPCGRSSHYIVDGIRRFSEKNGGDDKISCAATEGAHKEAMSFLTSFE